MRTAISPRLAMRTLPNTLTIPPTSSRTTGIHPAPSQALPGVPEARPTATGYASRRPYLLQRAPPARPRSQRPPPRSAKGGSSKWDVSVLAGWALGALGPDHLQGLDQVGTRLPRVYDVIYKANPGGDHGVVELLLVVFDELLAFRI